MELAAILNVGVLFGTGVYLLLQKSLLRVVLGTGLLAHGVNLLLLTSGKLKRGEAPILSETVDPGAGASHTAGLGRAMAEVPARITDPLPQALILTAIVIGFATTALILVIAYRTFQEQGTDDLDRLRGLEDE